MKGPATIRSIEPLDQIVERCRGYMNDWLLFGQILSSYPSPGTNKAQLEQQFLKIKSKLARELTILQDRLGSDLAFDPNTLNIVSGSTSLESIYSQSEMSVKKLQNEWHRAFIAMNESLGNVEDKRRRAAEGEKVVVGGRLYHIKQPLPWKQIFTWSGALAALLVVAGTLFFMRSFLGFWAPAAGEGIDVSDTMSDEEQIRMVMDVMQNAIRQENVDQMMTAYSDNFRDSEGRGKRQLRAFIQAYNQAEGLKDVRISDIDARIEISGSKATIGPMKISTPDDNGEFSVEMSRERGRWLITSLSGI